MKHLLSIFLFCFTSISAFGQLEFKTYSNGLIYPESTIKELKQLVASLQLKLDNTPLSKTYYSKPQAKGHYFKLEIGNLKAAKKDLQAGIAFEAFFKKYPEVEIERDLLILKAERQDRKGRQLVDFYADLHYPTRFHEVSISKLLDKKAKESKEKHLVFIEDNGYLAPHHLAGFFFTTEMESKPLPEKYARMLRYVDELIDVKTPKFKENATYEHQYFPKFYSDELSKTEQIKLLDYLRGIRIRAACGYSHSPRIHDFNIAKLAAQTNNWKLFLKAHLDILYLPLESMLYFNSEKGDRETYTKELEALGIDIGQLFLGMHLKIEDAHDERYSDSLLPFVLPEAQDKEAIKNQLLAMIQDPILDDYNRMAAYYLFFNHCENMEDKEEKKINIEKLKEAVAALPNYLSNKIAFKD